jgi:hypothetical protein
VASVQTQDNQRQKQVEDAARNARNNQNAAKNSAAAAKNEVRTSQQATNALKKVQAEVHPERPENQNQQQAFNTKLDVRA